MSYIDITGRVFNDLTAIRHLGSYKGQGALWLWLCVCGKEVEYPVHRVKKGHTKSCGCLRRRDCATIKLCKHCGQESLRLNRHGNPASVCHQCNNKQTNGFKYRNPKYWMLLTARARAKKQGIHFSLVEEDFEIPEFCPVLGIKLEPGTRTVHLNSPSLDKVVPELGYIKGNVAVISNKANMIKNLGTPEEHRRIADWVENFIAAAPEIDLTTPSKYGADRKRQPKCFS